MGIVRIAPLLGIGLLLASFQSAAASGLYSLARVQQGFTSTCQQGGPGFDMAEAHCVIPAVGSGFVDTAADAEAAALYGTLRGFTQLQTTAADGRNYNALATAEFTDTIEIRAPGQPVGSAGNGKLIFTVDVEHTIIERDLTSGSAFPDTDFFLRVDGSSRSPQGSIPNLEYFIAFQYGVPFEITATLQTKVVCNSCSGRYDIVTDGRNTATLDFVTVTGLALEDFSVFNESGEAYANVVPEPSSLALALASLAVLALQGSARRRRSVQPRRRQSARAVAPRR